MRSDSDSLSCAPTGTVVSCALPQMWPNSVLVTTRLNRLYGTHFRGYFETDSCTIIVKISVRAYVSLVGFQWVGFETEIVIVQHPGANVLPSDHITHILFLENRERLRVTDLK